MTGPRSAFLAAPDLDVLDPETLAEMRHARRAAVLLTAG